MRGTDHFDIRAGDEERNGPMDRLGCIGKPERKVDADASWSIDNKKNQQTTNGRS
jgi:hypothetical protein